MYMYFNTDWPIEMLKEAKLMDMILDKCIFQYRYKLFQYYMLLVHIGIASLRQFQFEPTTYVKSINDFFSP